MALERMKNCQSASVLAEEMNDQQQVCQSQIVSMEGFTPGMALSSAMEWGRL